MLYRTLGNTGQELSILGFGCMRLPIIDGKHYQIDAEKATQMLHYAIDQGVNYIDTAYPYHSAIPMQEGMSEVFVGKALQNGYRDQVHLATKLPSWLIKSRADMDYYLNQQLARLQTDHIDFYLLHSMNVRNWQNLKQLGVFEFLDCALADGRIKYAGFSFHDELPLFKEIVDAYNWSFCQIQYNFMDEEYQAGREGLEYAAAKGLGIVIMEPLRGGSLSTRIPAAVQDVWDQADTKRSPVEWALRFVWNHPAVNVVLSGMNEMEHVIENINIASQAHPDSLTEKEKGLIETAKGLYRSRTKVNCTNCQYCMPCPNGVNIPGNFSILNN
jgi:predicted aldo/keto reductase-like oxidoreductase